MAKSDPRDIALLLADIIEYNRKNINDYFPEKDGNAGRNIGKTAITSAYEEFFSQDVIRNGFPNYEAMGFFTQAFVDVTISLNGEAATEAEIRRKIQEDRHVVLVYTVFGEVDLRCKVVGASPREIERTAMYIKAIPGVVSSKTFMIIDETDYSSWRKRVADLIRDNSNLVGQMIQARRDRDEGLPPPV